MAPPKSRAITPRSSSSTADILIRDRQSRYGTFVGGEPITECELRPGDEIRLGRAGGATLVFLGADDSTVEATPNPREGLRQMTELLERLRGLGAGRLLQDVLALLLDAALELTRAERGFVMLAGTDGQLEFRMGRGPAGQALTDVTFETSRQVPTEVFRTGQTLVLQDLFADGVADDHAATRDLGIRHIICVPLHLVRLVDAGEVAPEERRLGVLYLDGQGRGSLVSPVTQSALETLAAEASLAIENARLYRQQLEKTRIEQELRLAAGIQQALLPRLDDDPGVRRSRRDLQAMPVDRRRFLRLSAAGQSCVQLRARRRGRQGAAGGVVERDDARHVRVCLEGPVCGGPRVDRHHHQPGPVPARPRGAIRDACSWASSARTAG